MDVSVGGTRHDERTVAVGLARGPSFRLALLAVVGVLATVALAAHQSGSTRAGTHAARHAVTTKVSAIARRFPARADLLSLPAAAAGPVSAALGRDQAAYRIQGLVANNPAQRISARFGRSGVAVTAGSTRLAISLAAFGRRSALWALPAVRPVLRAGRVDYARRPVREWWANGPLGLEQGFDIARRPSGAGALTLALAISGSSRLYHGTVLLPGGLRYAGLHASDARGRPLRAWLQLRDGRVLVRVDDRGALYPVRVDPFIQQAELSASDGVGGAGDRFGFSVAVSGNTVVVGAPFHAVGSLPQGVQAGAVYVFQKPAAGWANATQTAELTDPTLPNTTVPGHDELGYSVAILGNTIVAGAPAGSEVTGNGLGTQGTVDVFTTTGNWTSTSTPNDRLSVSGPESPLGGELGWSVAISGTTIVAGAPFDGAASPFDGVAYVFNEPGGGWSGAQTQAATLSEHLPPTGDDEFGWSVGISGTTIAVGAPLYAPGGHQHGATFAFTGPWSGSQTQTATLTASDPNLAGADGLGASVGVSGNTVVAGADNHQVGTNPTQGSAYVFVMPTSGWANATQTAELTASNGRSGDEFGSSVGISGNTIVAGAIQFSFGAGVNQGAVYVYTQPAGGWATTSAFGAELTASDGTTDDNLGNSVAVSGTTVLGGAPRHTASSSTANHGAAYVFGSANQVSTGVGCSPSPIVAGGTTTCTATVTDTATSGRSTPTGTVGFSSVPSTGTFGSSGRCTLTPTGTSGTASCKLTFVPAASGTHTIIAAYGGDSAHAAGVGTFSLSVTSRPALEGKLTIGGSAKVSSKGVAGVLLSCAAKAPAACKGKLTLTAKVKAKVKRKIKGHTKTVNGTKTVTLGSATYSLSAGKAKTLSVKLSKAGLKLLDAAHNHRLKSSASAKPSSGKTISKTVTLTAAPSKKHKK
jgi:hypothetical protein